MTDRTLFYIDTSALIRVFRFYPKELVKSMWKRLEKLFTSGIMISHIFVYEEITTEAKNSDFLSKCITPLRSCFKRTTFTQANLVKKIIEEFPGIIDVQKEKNQADPWLIALAIERKGELDLFSSSKKLYLVNTARARKCPNVLFSIKYTIKSSKSASPSSSVPSTNAKFIKNGVREKA